MGIPVGDGIRNVVTANLSVRMPVAGTLPTFD